MGVLTSQGYQLQPDTLGAMSRGLKLREQRQQLDRQDQTRSLSGQLLGGQLTQEKEIQTLAKLLDVNPNAGIAMQKQLGLDSESKLNEAADFAFRLERTPFEQRPDLINQRTQKIIGRGGDPSDTQSLLSLNQQDQDRALKTIQLLRLSPEQRLRVSQGTALKNIGFGGQETLKDKEGNLFFATTRRNKNTGKIESVVSPIGSSPEKPIGKLSAMSRSGLTMAEKIEQVRKTEEIRTTQKEKQAIDKLTVVRKQGFIDSGIEAADATANLKRGLELLKEVETGGIDAVLLKAKQFFGIEAADEAELISGLGKGILSQLRPIFGAQFTEREGERLNNIEANYTKSTAGNMRLIKQQLKILERAARRAIAAAENLGDDFTANEIKQALSFSVSLSDKKQQGTIMIDANGNRALVFPDGTFEEL